MKKPGKPKGVTTTAGSSSIKHSPSDISNSGNDSPPAAKKIRVGTATDLNNKQTKSTGLARSSVPVRGWGDEEDEQMREDDDDDDDELDEVEETEFEGLDEEESDDIPDEGDDEIDHDEEDEALDNGIDSD